MTLRNYGLLSRLKR